MTLTAKNPFELQSKVLMAANPEIRPALAQMMTDVTMQWSSCTTPSLQDVANDAVDEARKNAYLESTKLLCSVREKVPAPKIDVMRHKCMTMEDTVKWLLDSEAAKADDVVHKVGLAERSYYHLATGKLNEGGKTKVDSLTDEQRGDLKKWFDRSEADIHRRVVKKCTGSGVDPKKPLHGVHRVCVFNYRKAYDNQSSSILKAISDHDKLTKGRKTILIFIAVLLAVVIVVVVAVVVVRNKKKSKEAALVQEAHSASLGHLATHTTHAPVKPEISSFVKSLQPSTTESVPPAAHRGVSGLASTVDPMDAEIDRLALEIPK
jgi:hypothetical protein